MGVRQRVLTPPVSKSDAQRALVLARILGVPDPLPHEALLPAATRGSGTLLAEVRAFDPLPESFTVSSDQSSQFASNLLLGAASIAHRTHRPCTVRVEGARVSDGYLQMTVRLALPLRWGKR